MKNQSGSKKYWFTNTNMNAFPSSAGIYVKAIDIFWYVLESFHNFFQKFLSLLKVLGLTIRQN